LFEVSQLCGDGIVQMEIIHTQRILIMPGELQADEVG
jgi:hypothetical protein